ncbi:polysaccharide deacetylase family protein [bacterium]|nr:polysaccharide deacetylase family protein [bacterium]
MTTEETKHLLTFDIEDWYHPTLAHRDGHLKGELEDRVVEPTLRIISLLHKTNNKATFFVLGQVAEKFPDLIREMVQHGHEVGSHGYAHNLVYDYTKYQFETDIARSIEVLQKAADITVFGYRAPSWSLNQRTPWAWQVLKSFGFSYDSSLYPFKTYLYGDNEASRFEYEIEIENDDPIMELPPSAIEVGGRRLPFAGGFFLRVAPLWYIRFGLRQYEKFGRSAVVYLHPWEIDVDQPRLPASRRDRFIMYANIERTEAKLLYLLERYRFDSIANYLAATQRTPVSSTATLSREAA